MWKVTTLGDVCKMYQPQTISKKDMKNDGKYFVYGANGVIGKYNKYNHSEPQLLITCRGATCGSVNISQPFSWINGNAMVIQPDTSVVSLKFMEYVFRGGINLSKVITGSAQPQITRESLNPIIFFYPPLIEQQLIVAKLDAAFAEVDKAITIKKSTEKNIEKLKSSILNNLLNNNFLNTKIGDICELIYGKGLPKEKRVNENGIPAYGANGIKCYASEPLYNRPSIIIGRKGSAGELQWVDKPFWALDVTYYVLPNEKKVNLKFLYFLLQMQNLPKLAKGVKPGINRNEVYNINIKLPTIEEQIKISDKIEKIFKQQKILKELNDRINVNYHSLKLAIISKEINNKVA